MSTPSPIDYAAPRSDRPVPTDGAWRAAMTLTAIASIVGVAIFLAFLATGLIGLQVVGFLWLGVGGLLTFAAWVCGLRYESALYAVDRHSPPPPELRRRAKLGVLLPLANVPLAIACVVGGLSLASYRAHSLGVTNVGATTIDSVLVTDVYNYNTTHATTFGPLRPGERRRVYYGRGEGGTVTVTVTATANGQTTTWTDSYYEPSDPLEARLAVP